MSTGIRGGKKVRKADARFTLADYLNLPEYPRYELIEGELLLTPSPIFRHQWIVQRINVALWAWVVDGNRGLVVAAPMDVILSDETVVQPDVIVILNENRHIIRERIEGPPDLVVEVLSPTTKDRDLVSKRDLYAKHGIREYWIVDPDRRSIEVNEWTAGGYRSAGVFSDQDTLRSPVLPGFELAVERVFEEM